MEMSRDVAQTREALPLHQAHCRCISTLLLLLVLLLSCFFAIALAAYAAACVRQSVF